MDTFENLGYAISLKQKSTAVRWMDAAKTKNSPLNKGGGPWKQQYKNSTHTTTAQTAVERPNLPGSAPIAGAR